MLVHLCSWSLGDRWAKIRAALLLTSKWNMTIFAARFLYAVNLNNEFNVGVVRLKYHHELEYDSVFGECLIF